MITTRFTLLAVFLLFITNLSIAQRGKEGTVIAPGGTTTVNTYTFLTADATAGTNTMTVNNATMTGGAFGVVPLAPGDLLMVIQMQGVSMDINITPIGWPGEYTVPNDYVIPDLSNFGVNPQYWGAITNYNQSGLHERIEVLSVAGNVVTMNCNLVNSYTALGHVQVIRIPRYVDFTVNAGSTIAPTLWDGASGGVVAIEVDGTLTVNGTISASAAGFRGGALDPDSYTATGNINEVRYLGSYNNLQGSRKGEGIGGYEAEYAALFSEYGIGAAANGGGGGGYQNTGGGGGSNVQVGGGAYTGKGNPQGYSAIWDLESAAFGGSTSPGGGRGGYAYSNIDADETVIGPNNNIAWGGDSRMANGGFGGHPLAFVADRFWFGGGGGAGDQDSDEGGAGGRGGGIVFMNLYGSIAGSGTISATGEDGQNSNPTGAAPTGGNPVTGEDGAGGGGAGGTIHVENVLAFPGTMLLDVHGGEGGDQDIDNLAAIPDLEAGGPGGSGSGGYIRITSGAPVKDLTAGANGTTESTHMVNFPPNGATEGSDGFNPLPANPAFNLTLTDVSICSGSTASLTAVQYGTALGTVTWFDAMVGGTVLTTGLNYVTPALGVTTTYWVGVCPGSFREPVTVTILAPDDASFNYSAASYCSTDLDQAVTITGLGGGGFTIVPAIGLPINAGSGLLSVNGSTPGVYTVTYTTVGPCPNSSNQVVTITALDNAGFNYSAASYCSSELDQAVTITGEAGGSFSILPAVGLTVNPATGLLGVNGATPGVYTVTYTTLAPCSNTSNQVITITALDDASFNYSAASYCAADLDQAVTITGEAGGSFSILPAIGLPINAGSGLLSVNGATPGVYTVTYTTLAPCSNTSNQVITITALDNAGFSYSAAAYCVNDLDQAATVTGEAGGAFTILPAVGLPINSVSGLLSVAGATPGVYTITYTTLAPCSNTSNVVVTINAMDNAGFNYSAASYCENDVDQAVTITGLGGGGFTILPAVGLPINAGSGLLSVNGATPGVYTVTYTTSGTCPNTSNQVVTITALDNAGFNYSSATYCAADADQAVTITGLGGGGFTILPAVGLPINAGSGLLSVNGATPGVYTVTYATTGACPNSSNQVVTITATDNASFNYSAAAYCVNDVDQAVTITGELGGGFTILPAVGLPINAGSGLLSVNGATPGVYTITYTTLAPCSNSSNVVVTINAMDNAGFNYSAAAYCESDADQAVTVTGLGGGGFTILPAAGLPINAGSGLLGVNGATPGVYTVTYTTSGVCPNTSNQVVTINAVESSAFNYSAASYCANALDQAATITGVGGGGFTILPAVGLPINAVSGLLSVTGATPGIYTITYTTIGACPSSSNVVVTINALDNAGFNYSAASYCETDVDQAVTITGLGGGGFTILPAVGLPINAVSGLLSVNGATPGVYTITYTTAGACPNTSNQVVTINATDNAGFNYSAAAYCETDIDQAVTITGVGGGGFTIFPAVGLPIDAVSGLLSVTGATPGVYDVTYTTTGACPNSSAVVVTINATDNAGFNYSAASYCSVDIDQTVTITGVGGGGFTILPAVGLPVDAVSGLLSVNGATPGVYTITYTTTGICPSSSNQIVTITASDNTAFTTTSTCDGGTASVPVTAGGTFTFSVAPGDGASIDPVTGTVSGGTSGATYSIQYTTVGACGASSIQDVTALLSPAIDPVADVAACDSFPLPAITGLNLSGNEAYYNNSQALGGTAITGTLTTSQTVYIYDVSAGCTNETSFVVTVTPSDDPSFTLTDYCDGGTNSATITGVAGGAFAFNPAVIDGATIDAATGEITAGVPGTTYSVEYITTGVCPSNAIEQVTVFAIPLAPTVSADQTYCATDILNDMTASGGAGTFTWYDDVALTLADVMGTGATQSPYSTTGVSTYYVTETENGCEGPESYIIITIEDCDVIVPTAFTPDGDGANDDWELVNLDNNYPNNTVKVYNRWGNLIFESTQGSYDSNRWDGTFKGSLLPVASYFYIIEPNSDGVDQMTGSVSIILND